MGRIVRIADDAAAQVWLAPEKHRSSHAALPAIVPPASRMRVTTVASISGTYPSSNAEPFIIGTPATQILSLIATFLPLNSPAAGPDLGLPVPGVVGIFRWRRTVPGRARRDRRQRRWNQLFQPAIGRQRSLERLLEGCDFIGRQRQAELRSELVDLLQRRKTDYHASPVLPRYTVPPTNEKSHPWPRNAPIGSLPLLSVFV